MGFSGLARWVNADADAFTKFDHNIRTNCNGNIVDKWKLSLKSYRSTFGINPAMPSAPPTIPASSERSIFTVTMDDTVFVLLEDPLAPPHCDTTEDLTHYRNTFLAVRPPGNLENLLVMLKARWMPVRHAAGNTQNTGMVSMGAGTGLGMGPTGGAGTGGGAGKGHAGAAPNNPLAAAELTVEGRIYSLGTDWLVRVGLVRSKESTKGMVMEAEYLPLPFLRTPDDMPQKMVSNLLASILPDIIGANMYIVEVGQAQWDDVLWDRDLERKQKEKEAEERRQAERADADDSKIAAIPDKIAIDPDPSHPDNDDDAYMYGLEDTPHVTTRDWEGIDKHRRTAYLVIGALRQENLL